MLLELLWNCHNGFLCKLLCIPQKLVVKKTLSNYYPRTKDNQVILFWQYSTQKWEIHPIICSTNNYWASVIFKTLWQVPEKFWDENHGIPALEEFVVYSRGKNSVKSQFHPPDFQHVDVTLTNRLSPLSSRDSLYFSHEQILSIVCSIHVFIYTNYQIVSDFVFLLGRIIPYLYLGLLKYIAWTSTVAGKLCHMYSRWVGLLVNICGKKEDGG